MTEDFSFVTVKRDEIIFREDETGNCAYLIESGLVQISVERDGKFVAVATLGRGEIFGEMAIIVEGRRSATAIALEDCRLQRIEAQQFGARVESMDPVMRMMVEIIMSRFRSTLKRIENAPPALREIARPQLPHAAEAMKNIRLESELHGAVNASQFVPYYQPIIDLPTGKLAGFEALVRWVHPERGLISPDEFIPIAEQSNLITQITNNCLHQVCKDMTDLRARCLRNTENVLPVFVGINVTGRDLERPGFLNDLQKELVSNGLSTDMLRLEITESSVMTNLHLINKVLGKLRQLGFSIAIDDFGTGYSSMSYLAKLPVSTLKIDRSFVSAMTESAQNRKIVTTILTLASQLNLPVVAEGVSNRANEKLLRDAGCAYGQGYLYAKPKPVHETLDLIANWKIGCGYDNPKSDEGSNAALAHYNQRLA